MKCSPEFRKRVAEQAELARRKAGRGCTGQLFFTYGETKWILADLEELAKMKAEQAAREKSGQVIYRTDGSVEPPKVRYDGQPIGHHTV